MKKEILKINYCKGSNLNDKIFFFRILLFGSDILYISFGLWIINYLIMRLEIRGFLI